jgi:uncharacterized membrane protein YphA (DoxX/SURF4 family)
MLSVFPTLLIFQFMAPTILRVALGVIFLNFGITKIGRQRASKAVFFETIGMKPGINYVWIIGILEIILGLCFIAGFLTQVVAIITIIILTISIKLKKSHSDSFESSSGYLWLCLIIALSLLISGPGWMAIDMPL